MLSANPKETAPLRLDEERREIEAGLERSQRRDQFRLVKKEAVRTRDVQRAMLDLNPQIIHFSGHGEGKQGIVFENEVGQAKFVDAEALAGLFKLFADRVQCVILNACYSDVQAEAIARHIPYVIGMSEAIGDQAAIEFSVGFYDALGAGRGIEFAYALGCQSIQLAGIPEHLTPVLKKSGSFPTPLTPDRSPKSLVLPDDLSKRSVEPLKPPVHNGRLKKLMIAVLAVTSLIGATVVGLPLISQSLRPDDNACSSLTQAEKGKKLVVAIAQIHQGETISGSSLPSLKNQVWDNLKRRTESTVVICSTEAQIANDDEAIQLGKRLGAVIVVWGRMDALNLELKVTTVTREVDYLTSLRVSRLDIQTPQQLRELLLTVNVMKSFALSQLYQYEKQQNVEARQTLENALNIPEPLDLEGQQKEELAKIWAKAYYFLGQLYFPPGESCVKHEQDCDHAIESFEKGIAVYSKPYAAFIEQGVLLGLMGKMDAAVDIYSQLIQIAPTSDPAITARGNRAEILIEQGRFQEAEADLKIVCQHKTAPLYWFWLSLRGKLELLTGKVGSAKKTFQEVKALLAQDNPEVIKEVIEILARLSQKNVSLKSSIKQITTDLSGTNS
jgi:tetratricopeptide (TPR) repeat protein